MRGSGPRPDPLIGIVAPTYWEVVRFIRSENLKKVGPTSYLSEKIQLEIGGIGANNASRACEKIIRSSPSLILCVGFAGALREEIKAGDIVLDKDKSDPKILDRVREICVKRAFPCYVGQFWNSSTPLIRAEQKAEVSRKYISIAVEMEGDAVWRVARSREIPFCSIRAVSDTLTEDLPVVVTALGYRGEVGWKFWKKFLTSPWDWGKLFGLASNCGLAGRHLQTILSGFTAGI